jgi:integrase
MRKPYFIKSRQKWYVKTPDGRSQICLGKTRKEADKKWLAMQGDGGSGNITVARLAALYLIDAEKHLSHQKFISVRSVIRSIAATLFGPAKAIRPYQLEQWLDAKGWRRFGVATTYAKRLFSWGVEKGYLAVSPVKSLKGPATKRRERMVTRAEHERIITAAPADLRPLLIALWLTGMRPGNAVAATADHVCGDSLVFQKHKNAKKIKAPLTIYLGVCMQTLVKICLDAKRERLLLARPVSDAKAAGDRLREVVTTLGLPGVTFYSYRHSWITRALLKGIPVADVAALAGTSIAVISQHYSHVAEEAEHLRDAARRV